MVKIENKLFFILAILMALVVATSNCLVQFPVKYFNLENLLPYKRELSYYFYNCTTSFFSDNYFFFNENSHLGMMSVAIVLSGAYIFFSQNNSNIYKYLFIAYAVTTFIIYSTTYSISAIICSLFFSVYFLVKRKKKLFLIFLIFGMANYLVFYNFPYLNFFRKKL